MESPSLPSNRKDARREQPATERRREFVVALVVFLGLFGLALAMVLVYLASL